MKTESIQDQEHEDILAVFKLFDVNETGYVNPKELMTCLLGMDMKPYQCVIVKIVSFLHDFIRYVILCFVPFSQLNKKIKCLLFRYIFSKDEWLSYDDFKQMVEQTLNDSKTSLETMGNVRLREKETKIYF
jgi:hypothetical protein